MAHGPIMTHPAIEYIPRRDTTKYDDLGSRLSDQIRGPLWSGSPALTAFHPQNLAFSTRVRREPRPDCDRSTGASRQSLNPLSLDGLPMCSLSSDYC